jgi:FkbM family methyltransferase
MNSHVEKLRDLSSVWIYGDGGFAQEVSAFLNKQSVSVIGNITRDGFSINGEMGGVELYKSNEFPVVIGVFNHKDDPIEIISALESMNIKTIISPAKLMLLSQGLNFRKYYLDSDSKKDHLGKVVIEMSRKLNDEESINVLEGFIGYQQTGDVRSLVRSGGSDIQYLGRTLPSPFREKWLEGNLNWFDIGAFDGDTLRAIQESGRDLTNDNFICAEPDVINFGKLKSTVAKISTNVRLLNVAIGANPGQVDFIHEGTLSAHQTNQNVENNSIAPVEVMTIDQICLDFSPTHIKMDIEGAEMEALLGGMQTIISSRPKLAISLYHTPRDISELSDLLMTRITNYSWFIRSYGAHGYDTILYGLPN